MAYTFIPKTRTDLFSKVSDKAVAAEIFSALTYLKSKFPHIEDPIIIDPAKPKKFNITRRLDGELNEKDIKNILKLTSFKYGEGSRGGRGTGNKGNAFEQEFALDLERWRVNEPIPSLVNKGLIESLDETYDLKNWGSFEIIHEGGENKPRSLMINGNKILISPGLKENGSVLTDITIKSEDGNKVVYLSLKYSPTVTFFNAGTKNYLMDHELKAGMVKNPGGLALLNMFGLDNAIFCSIFNGKPPKNLRPVNTITKINRTSLENLIKSGIGYGYHMIHKIGSNGISNVIDEKYRNNASRVQSVMVYYGGKTGTGKRVDIEVVTAKYILKFNFRSKTGGNYISHFMCDYKYK